MVTIQEVRRAQRGWFTLANKKFYNDVAYSVRHSAVTGRPYLIRSTYAWTDMCGGARRLHWRINPLSAELQIRPLIDIEFKTLDDVKMWLWLN